MRINRGPREGRWRWIYCKKGSKERMGQEEKDGWPNWWVNGYFVLELLKGKRAELSEIMTRDGDHSHSILAKKLDKLVSNWSPPRMEQWINKMSIYCIKWRWNYNYILYIFENSASKDAIAQLNCPIELLEIIGVRPKEWLLLNKYLKIEWIWRRKVGKGNWWEGWNAESKAKTLFDEWKRERREQKWPWKGHF